MRHFGASPSLLITFDAEAAWLALTRTAIACQLYRRENGAFPVSLDELVPGYLDSVPLDPWSLAGTSFVYRVTSGYAELASVGRDGTFDGGFSGARSNRDWYEDDFGILIRTRINHPEQAEEPEKTE